MIILNISNSVTDKGYDKLAERATVRQQLYVRPGTEANHKTALRSFTHFCEKYHLKYYDVDEDMICVYMEELLQTVSSPATVNNYISSLKVLFKRMKRDITPFTSDKVHNALRSIANTIRHVENPSEAIPPHHLVRIIHHLEKEKEASALIFGAVLMFTSLLRQSNIAPRSVKTFDSTRHLTRGDIQRVKLGLQVNHKWAKCHQSAAKHESIPLPKIKNSPLCPVFRHGKMLRKCPTTYNAQPLLMFQDGSPIPLSFIGAAWNRAVKAARLTHYKYTMHGLRKGGAQWIQSQTGDDNVVAEFGLWKSNSVKKYIKDKANDKALKAFKKLSRNHQKAKTISCRPKH